MPVDSVPLLASRDRELLEALAVRVRVLSLAQIARTWWPATGEAIRAARRRVQQLEAAGLVEHLPLFAHPELPLAEPLATWHPDQPPPDFGAISYRAKARWDSVPVQTPAVIATLHAGRQFGGHGGRAPRPTEQTHDLHLAAVYLRMRSLTPKRAAHWQSEAEILKRRQDPEGKLPDAMVVSPHEHTAIEFVGQYPKDKLIAFHGYCAEHHWAYELW